MGGGCCCLGFCVYKWNVDVESNLYRRIEKRKSRDVKENCKVVWVMKGKIFTFSILKNSIFVLLIVFALYFCINSFFQDADFVILETTILLMLLMSAFFSIFLDKQEIGIFLSMFSSVIMIKYYGFLSISYIGVLIIIPLISFSYFISHRIKSKLFLFLIIWILAYYIFLFVKKPYIIPIGFIARNILMLSIFVWSMFIQWDRKKILSIVYLFSGCFLLCGVLEYLILDVKRVGGPSYATVYAIILSVAFTILLADFCINKKNNKIFTLFIFFLILIMIFLSGSKQGLLDIFIGISLGIMIFFITKDTNIPRKMKIIYIFSAMAIFICVIFMLWNFLPKDNRIIGDINDIIFKKKFDNSSLGRITCWFTAWDMFSKEPILGMGPGSFMEKHAFFLKSFNLSQTQHPLPFAHNVILQVLATTGLVGFFHIFVIVVLCILQAIKHIIKNSKNSLAYTILAGYIVLLCSEMVDEIILGFDPWLLGVLASFGLTNNKEETAK
jgi:O-antigen ligase